MRYVFQYDIVAFIISLIMLIAFYAKKTIDTKEDRGFFWLFFLCLNSSLFDLLGVYFIENPTQKTLWLNYIINMAYMLFLHAIPVAFLNCIFRLAGDSYSQTGHKRLFLFVPYTCAAVLILLTPFLKTVFYFDEELMYRHGRLLLLVPACSAIYVILGILLSTTHRKKYSTEQLGIFYFFSFFAITAMIIQLYHPPLLISQFAVSIGAMLSYLTLNNPGIYIDRGMEIYNNRAFRIVVQDKIQKNKPFGIVSMQFFGLNLLNESFGIKNTNLLLKQLPTVIKVAAKTEEFYKISGSRISIIVPEDEDSIKEIIERLKIAFEDSFRIHNMQMPLPIRLSYLRFPEDANNVEDIFDLIITSLHTTTQNQVGSVTHADRQILMEIRKKNQIFQLLQQTAKNNDFYIVYQPIYSVKSNSFSEVKALIRMKDGALGYISPKEFLPLAEQSGLIFQIMNFMFRDVCRFILKERLWEKGIKCVHIGLPVIQCLQENLHRQLLEIINLYGIQHSMICLEITEEAVSLSSPVLKRNLDILREQGVRLSLDNFGYGVSKTANMVSFAFKTVKLDKALVWGAEKELKVEEFLQNTIRLIHSLNIEVLAEGIETEAQAELMKRLECNYLQGFFYSRPLLQEDFLKLLK